MYCRNCGAEVNENAVVCLSCGAPTGKQEQKKEQNPLALVGFILSFFMQLAGLVCSIIAYRRCKDDPELEGKNMALAGIIISSITIGLVVFAVVVWIAILIGIISSLPVNPSPDGLARIFSALI